MDMGKASKTNSIYEFPFNDNAYYRRTRGRGPMVSHVLGNDGRWKPYPGGDDKAYEHEMRGEIVDDPTAGNEAPKCNLGIA
jgi:hypothetical protein